MPLSFTEVRGMASNKGNIMELIYILLGAIISAIATFIWGKYREEKKHQHLVRLLRNEINHNVTESSMSSTSDKSYLSNIHSQSINSLYLLEDASITKVENHYLKVLHFDKILYNYETGKGGGDNIFNENAKNIRDSGLEAIGSLDEDETDNYVINIIKASKKFWESIHRKFR